MWKTIRMLQKRISKIFVTIVILLAIFHLFMIPLSTYYLKHVYVPVASNLKAGVSIGYHSGGAGYVLSKEALKRLYEEHHKPNTTCLKDGGSEDIEIAQCLRESGVYQGKSVDKDNRERFHPIPFSQLLPSKITKWLHDYAGNKPVTGLNCCSNTTISFHYVTPEHQYLIDKMHYGFHSKT